MYEVKPRNGDELHPLVGLGAYNRCFIQAQSDISCAMEDEAGRCIAGLVGWQADGLAMVDVLWVEEAFRGQGLGTRLLRFAEEAGRTRGARLMELNTFGFQAPGFYEKQGYRRFAALEGDIGQYGHYFYVKEL